MGSSVGCCAEERTTASSPSRSTARAPQRDRRRAARRARGRPRRRRPRDAAVRGVVLTGAGGAFCAGGDLARFDELHDARAYRHVSHRLTELDRRGRAAREARRRRDRRRRHGAGLRSRWPATGASAAERADPVPRGALGLVPPTAADAARQAARPRARKEVMLGGDDLDARPPRRAAHRARRRRPSRRPRARREDARPAPLSFAPPSACSVAADSTCAARRRRGLAQTALLQSDDHREGWPPPASGGDRTRGLAERAINQERR